MPVDKSGLTIDGGGGGYPRVSRKPMRHDKCNLTRVKREGRGKGQNQFDYYWDNNHKIYVCIKDYYEFGNHYGVSRIHQSGGCGDKREQALSDIPEGEEDGPSGLSKLRALLRTYGRTGGQL
jgi:hypothetical protein